MFIPETKRAPNRCSILPRFRFLYHVFAQMLILTMCKDNKYSFIRITNMFFSIFAIKLSKNGRTDKRILQEI